MKLNKTNYELDVSVLRKQKIETCYSPQTNTNSRQLNQLLQFIQYALLHNLLYS